MYQFSLIPDNENSGGDGEVSSDIEFPNQTLWERYYMEQASYYGCIIFWLPCEDKENPRKKEDGPYARDTYGEIGRWSIKSSMPEIFSFRNYSGKRVNVIIGAEEKFPGLSTIRTNLDSDHKKPDPFYTPFFIFPSLKETVYRAMKLARKTNPSPMNFND